MYKIPNDYISDIGAWNLDIVCHLSFGAWNFPKLSTSCVLDIFFGFKINELNTML